MLPKSGPPPVHPTDSNRLPGHSGDASSADGDQHPASGLSGHSIVVTQRGTAKQAEPASGVPESANMAHTPPALAARGVAGSGETQSINTEPRMIAEGVFIGEGKAKSGEKVFLRMEKVTEANKPLWEQYCRTTAQLTLHGRSALTYAMRGTKAVTDVNGSVRFVNEQYEDLADRLGQTREEFDDFIKLLGKNGFAWEPKNKPRIAAVHNIHAGATHLALDTASEHYVVYASKTADFRMPPDSVAAGASRPLTFKEYIRFFGDLLICVGVNFPDATSIHSKGMFRNPGSVIENTHKGLSMVLRGFSGAVTQKYFPDRRVLSCKPLSSMQYMISCSLRSEDYRVEGHTHEEALSNAEESMREGQVYEMPHNIIKISALDRLYRSHAST